MTPKARFDTITVTLDSDYSQKELQPVLAALKMVKGVIDATPEPVTSQDHAARERVRAEMEARIWDALRG